MSRSRSVLLLVATVLVVVASQPVLHGSPTVTTTPAAFQYPAGLNLAGAWATTPVMTGDFNGDGRTDFMRPGGTSAYFFVSDGAGGFSATTYTFPNGWDFLFDQKLWQTVMGDFDLDGRTDFMMVGQMTVKVFRSQMTGIPAAGVLPNTAFIGTTWTYPNGWKFTPPWSETPVSVGDFNGDGRTDFLRAGATYAHIFLNDGTGGFSSPYHYFPAGMDFGFDQTLWHTVADDVDGDGRTDFMEVGQRSVTVFYSQLANALPEGELPATSFTAKPFTYPNGWKFTPPWSTTPVLTGDFNGDHLIDFIRPGATYTHLFLNDGVGGFKAPYYFFPAGWDFGFDQAAWRTAAGDFNGDGRTDFIYVGPTAAKLLISELTTSPEGELPSTAFTTSTINYPAGWDFGTNPSLFKLNVLDIDGNGRSDLLRVGFTGAYWLQFYAQGQTTLVVSPSTASLNATVTLDAHLTDRLSKPVAGQTITFLLNGTGVGTGTTDPNGLATLSNVSLAGIAAGSYAQGIGVRFDGDVDHASTTASARLEIGKKLQTIAIQPIAPQTFGSAPFQVVTTPGASGEPVALSGSGACVVSGSLATITAAGDCVIAAQQASNETYEPATAEVTVPVAPATLTVTTQAVAKDYGQPNPAFTASYSGFVNGDNASALTGTLAFSTTATTGSAVGSYAVTPSGITSHNYTIAFAPGTLTVNPAMLTVAAGDATKTYGQPNPAFTASYAGFVLGEDAGALTGTLAFSTPATDRSAVGSYAVTPGGVTSNNYALKFVNGALTVNPAALTVTANTATKTYGQPNPLFTASYSGFIPGDDASALNGMLTFSTAATDGSPVGSYAVTPSGLTSNNYAVAFASGTLKVDAARLTITANAASRTYGQPNPMFTASYAGFVQGDTASALTGALTFSTAATEGSPAGSYAVTPSGVSSGNYAITFAPGTLTVDAAALTVTAGAASRTYGDPNPAFTASYTGFVAGDDASALQGTLTFSTAATERSAVGSYAVTPGGVTSSNYAVTFVDGTLAVNPAALTVTAGAASKTYGNPNPGFTASYAGFVLGDDASALVGTLTFSTAATERSAVGSYAVTPGGVTSGNYALAFMDGSLTVTPAALTVMADPASKGYGQPNPVFTASYAGFVEGDDASALNGTLAFTTAASAGSSVGTYAVTPGGVTSGNYTLTFVDGTLTVKAATLTVTANAASKAYGQPNPTFTASYAGFLPGDDASALSGTLAFTTAATAGSPVGSYAVTPGGITSSNYTLAFVDGTLAVKAATLTVTANAASKTYGQPNPAFAASYAGFLNGDDASALSGTLAFTTAATAGSPVGSYAVTPGGVTSANYTVTFVDGQLTVTPAAITVTAGAASKAYGQPNPVFTASYAGFVNGDDASALAGALAFTTTASASSPVGSYAVTPSGVTSGNYTLAFVDGTLTVKAATLTVTANAASKTYGQPNPAFAASYAGFVTGDDASTLGGTLAFTTTAIAGSPAGSYQVTPGGVTSANYTFTFVNGTLTVNPAALTVTANAASRTSAEPNPAFTASYAGFIQGDDASKLSGTLAFTTTATATSAAGTYPVTPAGVSSPNYTITFVDGTLTVTAAAASDPDGRLYGRGLITDGSRHHLFMFRVSQLKNKEYGRLEYTSIGGRQLLDVARDDDSYDGDDERGYGRDHRGVVNRFEATAFTQMRFSDDPAFVPGKGKSAPTVDSVSFSGTGKWNGKSGYTFEASATDRGDGRGTSDTFILVVRDSKGATVATVSGTILAGKVESTRLKANAKR